MNNQCNKSIKGAVKTAPFLRCFILYLFAMMIDRGQNGGIINLNVIGF